MQQEFYSNGKLLLSAEYAILDGAQGLAIPTKYGQSLTINPIEKPILLWKSITHDGDIWFEAEFTLDNLSIGNTTNEEVANTLQGLLIEAKKQNSNFLEERMGFEAMSRLTFPRDWGLGSSSTLINNIAQWAQIDAYQLLWNAFGGSGYDIACAQYDTPIMYSLKNKRPMVQAVAFDPPFKDSLFFVYLNQKQSSKQAIAAYRQQSFDKNQLILEINGITQQMISCDSLDDFIILLEKHESLLSKVLGLEPVKSSLFPDFSGAIKSLGAWGGDFALVTGDENSVNSFVERGFETVLPYNQMVLT
ncbi:GYDIA family GHMP kinase [Flagellimonas meridianipacifica]|uniref:Mevalonate kinase n=1 Tax=Flagellimonas meridianipacifica TaxID=1080225 RepID=A0A2T0MFP2_9FLAO|nr:GYDIA family GHMP kinase [Allomuricauda pacifica]PRX56356.1 mevalonate kinase [Allomuricauda pacifica]